MGWQFSPVACIYVKLLGCVFPAQCALFQARAPHPARQAAQLWLAGGTRHPGAEGLPKGGAQVDIYGAATRRRGVV